MGHPDVLIETPVDATGLLVAALADVVTLQRRRQARISAFDEESSFLDTLSEYQWPGTRPGWRRRRWTV